MWRPLAVMAAIAALALAAVQLTFSAGALVPADFRFVNRSEPETLDPGRMSGEPEVRIANELFEGLTRRDPKTLAPAPGVAERWERSADGRRWTFHLRRDARWSDGRPVTAGDFEYAWRRLRDPATGAAYAELLDGVRDFRAVGEHRFDVELEAPIPYFLELTALFPTFPVPRWAVEAHGRRWFLPEHLVGNGPFRLESWRVGDRIRLVPNPHYWARGRVKLRSIDALPVENAVTALNLYLTDAVDWLPRETPPELVDVLRERDDFYSGPGMIVYFYRLNVRRPPLDDPRVRQAIGLAIDRREITDEVLRLGQIPATTLVPPGMPGYESPRSGLGYDPERARALLAEAGFADGGGMRELGILYNTDEQHKKVAEVIADQLRRNLGLRVRAYNQEWQSYLASVDAGDYDIARAGWIGDYLDPNTFLDLWVSGAGNNGTGWSDPDYDALIAAARAEADPARRMALLQRAEFRLVNRGFPVLPIYFYVVSGLVKPHVEGFYTELELADGSRAPNLQDLHPLREVWVGEP